MGVVLLARDVALDRPVAIKVLPKTLARNPAARERFLREAQTAAGLFHPHIVPIHLVEAQQNWVFFVMGYIDGETLRERVQRHGPLTARAASRVMQEAAWALAYAHERGVVHRDIKPDNVMIERATDRTLITDFGIAVVGRSEDTGEVIGTARFMSPEQACGEAVDGRSDLYALGATIFFALTGRAPFEASSLPALLAKQVAEPVPPLAELHPQLSPRLVGVVTRCLEKPPTDRFQSGEELAAALDTVRGRDLRAPPLVRSFVRNAQVTTMVMLAVGLVAQGPSGSDPGSVTINLGPLLVGFLFLGNLVSVARRLLREGYAFDDIRAALLAEAELQDEEAEEVEQRRWQRRLNSVWHRLWAGRFGRWFFRITGVGITPPPRRAVPSMDHTELVLARSVEAEFERLTRAQQKALPDLPAVVDRLQRRAVALRSREDSGAILRDTLAALENVRVALLRLSAGGGSVDDLTHYLEEAREIGRRVDGVLAVHDGDR